MDPDVITPDDEQLYRMLGIDPAMVRRGGILGRAAQGEIPAPGEAVSPQAPPSGSTGGVAGLQRGQKNETLDQNMGFPSPTVQASPSGGVKMQRSPMWSEAEQHISEKHPFWGGVLKGLDVVGSVLAPGAARMIPGTRLNQGARQTDAALQAKNQQALADEETARQETQARIGLTGAQTQEANARAEAIKNPPDKAGQTPEEVTIHDLMTGENGAPRTNPQTGKPYSYLEAYQAVKQTAESTKPQKAAHITYDSGIPVSVTDSKGNVFDVNDPNLPQELKPLVDSANRAHKQHTDEANAAEDRRTAASDRRQAAGFEHAEKMFQEHQEALTSSTKTMIETVPKVESLSKRIREIVNDPEFSDTGPLAGRWAELWAGKVGSDNPKFTKLRTDTAFLQTALMRMHVGARGGEQMMEHFKGIIDSGRQSKANMLSALDAIDEYAKDVAAEGKKPDSQTQGNEPVEEYERVNGKLVKKK